MKDSDRILNRLKAIYQEMLRPEEIRRISKKLHLTQEAAETASDRRRSSGLRRPPTYTCPPPQSVSH